MSRTYRNEHRHKIGKQNRRSKKMTMHHLTAKSNGGSSSLDNILHIWAEKHEIWHKIFGNLSLEQCISVLQRVARMKGRSDENRTEMPRMRSRRIAYL